MKRVMIAIGGGHDLIGLRAEPQQLLEENLKTGETVRIINGQRMEGISLGSRNIRRLPAGFTWHSSLPSSSEKRKKK